MNNIHLIKLNEKFVTPILNGEKTFEIRNNDRGYNKGDLIKFIVVDNNGIRTKYYPFSKAFDVETKTYEITYVLSGFHIDKDYVVFSFKEYL